ncbi:MAG: prepilin-type N-terminal cleavage/methylation domain-containing protein [Acidobacteria bacterium]|nr:prepilin-type N-terminal cleavage/methylation domain-containing protein [Acidobacteriota bacterium]
MKKQSGFTLIELLLVLAIIGIIAAIAIPALLGQRNRAKAKAVQQMVSSVAGEIARTSDTMKELSLANWSGPAVVNAITALSNYAYPAAKNPYGGTVTPYHTGAPAGPGEVGLVFNNAFLDPANGQQYPAIIVQGQYQDPNNNMAAATASKVVALD